MLSSTDIFFCAVLPLLVSATLVVPLRRFPWGISLAIAAAFAAAFAGIEGLHAVSLPNSAPLWLFYTAIVLALFAMIAARCHWPRWAMMAGLFGVVGVASGIMLRFNFVQAVWTPVAGSAVLATLGIIAVIDWLSFRPAIPDDTIVASLAMSMVAGFGGLSVMMLADQPIGEAMAALGVAMLPLAVAAIIGQTRLIGRSELAAVFAGIIITSLTCAVYASDVPRSDALLVAGAPLLFWLTRFIPRGPMRAWQHGLIRLLITAVPLGVALAMGARALQQERASGAEMYSLLAK